MKNLITLVALLIALPAQADLYKCATADGKVTYSDRPCGKVVDKIKIKKEILDTEGALARLEKDRAYLADQRKKSEIGGIQQRINNMHQQKRNLVDRMDGEINALRGKKQYSRNNLAGATWEQSISTEMQAVSERYRVEINSIDQNIRMAQAEIDRLQSP